MSYARREVPLSYVELRDAIANGVFPAERHWIDFKRELYQSPPANGAPSKPKDKKDVHRELARDLASLAVRGGFLVFGVAEDKTKGAFTVQDMPLPAGLDVTIDQVARDQIDPPLLVAPTLLHDPQHAGRGLLVVEVPDSPYAPHMVDGAYYGRSETGKVKLSDAQVERMILGRGRVESLLEAEMKATAAADPESPADHVRFYLTAVALQAPAGFLLDITRDSNARQAYLSNPILESLAARDEDRPADLDPGLTGWREHERSAAHRGAWFYSFPLTPPESRLGKCRRMLGLGDDGVVRFLSLTAGTQRNGVNPWDAELRGYGLPSIGFDAGRHMVYDNQVLWATLEFLRLLAALSEARGYRGVWMLGAQLTHVKGACAASTRGASMPDLDDLTAVQRAVTYQLARDPRLLVAELLRPLLREFGVERKLDRFTAGSGNAPV